MSGFSQYVYYRTDPYISPLILINQDILIKLSDLNQSAIPMRLIFMYVLLMHFDCYLYFLVVSLEGSEAFVLCVNSLSVFQTDLNYNTKLMFWINFMMKIFRCIFVISSFFANGIWDKYSSYPPRDANVMYEKLNKQPIRRLNTFFVVKFKLNEILEY